MIDPSGVGPGCNDDQVNCAAIQEKWAKYSAGKAVKVAAGSAGSSTDDLEVVDRVGACLGPPGRFA